MTEKTADKITKTESEWRKQLSPARCWHRVRLYRSILEQPRRRDVSLRLLRGSAVRFEHEV